MRVRCSARLLIFSPSKRVLLFRFEHKNNALAGKSYWATPGGGVEPGETYEQAAIRELKEETGIIRDNVGRYVAKKTFEMMLPSGETVLAKERFFVAFSNEEEIHTHGWTENERSVIRRHYWWGLNDLLMTQDLIHPNDIAGLMSMSFED